jgi:UDP-GlcNAc:undecaprenyl-phosphate GlcNAc-1-phosphate transferase
MASVSILDSLVFASGLATLAAALTGLMLKISILAVPNARSSHHHPVPSSGGVAIVATTYLGVVAAYLIGPYFQAVEKQLLGLGLASLVVATVGLMDDLGRVTGFRAKLSAQLFACAILLASGIVIDRLTLPFVGTAALGVWGYPLTAVWVIGLTNIFNFMDGLDGLAAGTAIIVAVIFGLICLGQGALFSYVLCYALSAASFGLLVFNFPRAKIFMGDVGSQFLGFVLAVIAVLAAEYDAPTVSVLVMPLLLFNFIFDTVFTFVRRLCAGENVTQAHKSHLYQLMNQLGYSHVQVSLFHFAAALGQGAGAVVLARDAVADPALVFLPFVLFQCAYAALILRATRRREQG